VESRGTAQGVSRGDTVRIEDGPSHVSVAGSRRCGAQAADAFRAIGLLDGPAEFQIDPNWALTARLRTLG
jgi:hypothetical protein